MLIEDCANRLPPDETRRARTPANDKSRVRERPAIAHGQDAASAIRSFPVTSVAARMPASDAVLLRSCFSLAKPSLAAFDVDWFCNLCLAARNLDDVHSILRMVHEGAGSMACALAQTGPTRRLSTFQLLVDVPEALTAAIVARPMADDAIMIACKQRVLGFPWSDLERIIDMNDRRRETLAIYASYGMSEGFTVPLSVPGEPRGFCSFAWSDPRQSTRELHAVLVIAAQALFETARRVLGMWVEHREKLELTPRQVDCLAGVACGLNDAQIAYELGISVQTVHDHLEIARKRYGAHKRTDLMVKAIRSGELPWSRITGSRSAWASARYRAAQVHPVPIAACDN